MGEGISERYRLHVACALGLALAAVSWAVAPTRAEGAFVGSNGAIGFTSDRPPAGLYAMASPGALATRLESAAQDGGISYSPDGGRIVFASSRPEHMFNSEIYIARADGSDARRLTFHDGQDSSPSFSSDGRRIVFGAQRPPLHSDYEIYSMALDGSDQRRLTTDAAYDNSPTMSSAGGQIVFLSLRAVNYEVFTMNADGSAPRNVTQTSATEFDPRISPDGTRIAFTSDRAPHGGDF